MEDNSELFFKLFRINYIRSNIFRFLKLYNINQGKRRFSSYNDLKNFKHKEYLQNVFLDFNEDPLDLEISDHLETIEISYKLEELKSDIPSSITSLIAPSRFNLKHYKSATKLKKLQCKYVSLGYHSPFFNELPDSVEELTLMRFRYPIFKEKLPKNLKKLILDFDRFYNRTFSSGQLPLSIEYLEINVSYQSFLIEPRILHYGLKTLKMDSHCMKIPEDFYFPETLTSISLCFKDSYPCNGLLPNSLKKLKLSMQKLPNQLCQSIELPLSVEKYKFVYINYPTSPQSITRNMIPKNVVSLKLVNVDNILDPNNGNSILPSELQNLEITSELNNQTFNNQLKANQFPKTLKKLSLKGGFNNGGEPLSAEVKDPDNSVFPSSLVYLEFGDSFNQPLGKNVFSKSGNLETIKFGQSFNQIIDIDLIPSSVKTIEITNFDYPHTPQLAKLLEKNPNIQFLGFNILDIFNKCPEKLKSFEIRCNRPLNSFNLSNKCNLEKLIFSNEFNQTLLSKDLPVDNNIKVLKLGSGFYHQINLDHFKNLETLYVNDANFELISSYSSKFLYQSPQLITESIDYNLYNLKEIIVNVDNSVFIDSLNEVFYQFVRIKKNN
ncbi:hypothetical protein DICPUDRAFT_155236 [Dictyostelium purpureum]|uniref:FNIP repeat-containing protein n=1 Tax=Dictyostelium purpureum TaxID=5786 RepID=F0ZTF3_DICPU|nr:uncharacterized protein DICPUDRAFT_155236 [Dictyostelium purpureum]EGC32772.1 hypothetical protein DICPUDRAFT_155236 [Dictyostelium purpureum]|eukprot:XP_003290695.1 hypothetical protein DICPUDRAFT_155236 [Dictyostelium purpureum]